MNAPERPAPNLELLRHLARRLLKAAHAAEPDALRRLRVVPRLAALDDAALAAAARLADAQHALAREYGADSWPKLKQLVEEDHPLPVQAERLLAFVRQGQAGAARRLLALQPELATYHFLTACVAGAPEPLERALAADPRNAQALHSPWGWRPLLYVCASPLAAGEAGVVGQFERCADLLLEAGAEPDTAHDSQAGEGHPTPLTALYYACLNNRVEIVRRLLTRGANPNDGESVYHAAERNHRDCLALLERHGAELSARHPRWNNTPLYFLAGYRADHPAAPTVLQGMDWLLERGADPNVGSYRHDETPLFPPARSGWGEAVELLLAHGAAPDRPRADGRRPYAEAVRAGQSAVAARLVAAGADAAGLTPEDELLGACLRLDEAAARALLAAHPELPAGLSPEGRGGLVAAAMGGRHDAVRLMVALGFDLGWPHPDTGTALHWAAWHARVDTVALLLELGAPLDVRDTRYGSSPIAWAAHGSANARSDDDAYEAVVRLLLAAGPDRAASYNHWNEPPEALATPRVAALLRARGFAPPIG